MNTRIERSAAVPGLVWGAALILGLWHPPAASAQQPADTADYASVQVFVAPFVELGNRPQIQEMGSLAAGIFALELKARSRLVVTQVPRAPLCEGGPAELATGADTVPRMEIGEYALTGSIRFDSTGFLLMYRIERCESTGLAPVVEGEPTQIPWSEASVMVPSVAGAAIGEFEQKLPRTTVNIGTFEIRPDAALSADYGAATAEGMLAEVATTEDFRPVEAAGEYHLTGWTESAGPGRLRVSVRVERAAKPDTAQLVSVVGARDSVFALNLKVARLAIERMRRERLSDRLTPGKRVEALSRDSLLRIAQRSLACAGSNRDCGPADPQTASVVSRMAIDKDTRDWRAHALLGRAELVQGNSPYAAFALEQAWRLTTSRTGTPEKVQLLNDLAASYRTLNEHREAARFYRLSLDFTPRQPEVSIARARSLLALDSVREALSELGAAVRQSGADPMLRREIVALIGELDAAALAGNLAAVVEACRTDRELQKQCARALAARVHSLYGNRAPPALVRGFASAALSLGPQDPQTRLEVYGVQAASYLGEVTDASTAEGELAFRFRGGAPDSVVKYLDLGRQTGTAAVAPYLREWLLRTEAWYWASRGELLRADSAAKLGLALSPSQHGRFMVGTLAYARARQLESDSSGAAALSRQSLYEQAVLWLQPLVNKGYRHAYRYYRAASHHSGQDRGSRGVFEEIVERNPSDIDARIELTHIYVDYLKEFASALDLYSNLERRGRLNSAGDSLSAAEAATLTGDLAAAQRWLRPLLAPSLGACQGTVAYFYLFWIEGWQGRSAEAGAAFDAWARALGEHRSRREGPCWAFVGAGHRLGTPPEHPLAETLAGMIAAMRESSVPPPRRPGAPPS